MIKLIGITQTGKNRIREHGEYWTIIQSGSRGVLLQSIATDYLKWGIAPDFKEVECNENF